MGRKYFFESQRKFYNLTSAFLSKGVVTFQRKDTLRTGAVLNVAVDCCVSETQLVFFFCCICMLTSYSENIILSDLDMWAVCYCTVLNSQGQRNFSQSCFDLHELLLSPPRHLFFSPFFFMTNSLLLCVLSRILFPF